MSYSTAANLAKRIGPKIYADLTTEVGAAPSDTVATDELANASKEIDIRIGARTNATAKLLLANLEEQIALWFLWVRRGIGEQETAAAAAKVGYDAAIKLLESGELNLPPETTTTTTTSGWSSNTPVYTKENFRSF